MKNEDSKASCKSARFENQVSSNSKMSMATAEERSDVPAVDALETFRTRKGGFSLKLSAESKVRFVAGATAQACSGQASLTLRLVLGSCDV